MEAWLEIFYKEKWNLSQENPSGIHGTNSNCTESHPALDQEESLNLSLNLPLNLPFEPLTPLNTAKEPPTYPYTPPTTPDFINASLPSHRTFCQQDRPYRCYNPPLHLDSSLPPEKMSFKGIDTFGKAFRPETPDDSGSSPIGNGPQQEPKAKGSSVPTPPSDGPYTQGMSGLPGTLIMAVPFPGTPGAPYFDGTDVSDFLDRYEDMCTDYQVSEAEKIRRIPRYCETMTGQYIKNLMEYLEKDYEALITVMKAEYKSEDTNQQINTRSFLESFKGRTLKDDEDVAPYCRRFSTISEHLVAKGKLDKHTQIEWFLQGLPPSIKSELFLRYEVKVEEDKAFPFASLLKLAISLGKSRKRLQDLSRPSKKSARIEDLVERSMQKAHSTDNLETEAGPSSKGKAPTSSNSNSAPAPTRTKSAPPPPLERKVDELADAMKKLSLNFLKLQEGPSNPPFMSNPANGLVPPPIWSNGKMERRAPGGAKLVNSTSTSRYQDPRHDHTPDCCLYCGVPASEHYLKRHCNAFQEDLNSERVHLVDGRIHLGKVRPGAPQVYMRPGRLQRDCICDAEKLAYAPDANLSSLTITEIGEDQQDEISSDEEEGDQVMVSHSPEASISSIISAAMVQKKPPPGLKTNVPKDPAHRIMKRPAPKDDKKSYATPKNVRFGAWNPVPSNPLPEKTHFKGKMEVKDSEDESDTEMGEAEPLPQKIEKRVPGPAVKEFVQKLRSSQGNLTKTIKGESTARSLVARGLDNPIVTSLREIIDIAPLVERLMKTAMREGKEFSFKLQPEEKPKLPTAAVNLHKVDFSAIDEALKDTSYYAMGTPKCKTILNYNLRVMTLLDCGAEVNVMTRQVMDDAGLAMRTGPLLKLIAHNGQAQPFIGLCENVEVDIGGLVTVHPIFVVETAVQPLILGQPFLTKTRFSQEYRRNEVFGTIHNSDMTVSVVFRVLDVLKSAHYNREALFDSLK